MSHVPSRSSPARSMLLGVWARIALVIVLTTLVHSVYILRSTRAESILRLEHLVSGVALLLVELALVFWVLQRYLSRPLLAIARAASQVQAGDFHVSLDTSRGGALGQLAQDFQRMAHEVQRREETLRQANEALEHRVEALTREFHQERVDMERRAGMGEIAITVLDNARHVLAGLTQAVVLARQRLDGLRLEGVSRVAGLLEEHQPVLARFLTEDERGRQVLPYLNRLGEHLLVEQQELRGLLDAVDEHTDHLYAIVNVQAWRSKTRPAVSLTAVSLAELVEKALSLLSAKLSRHQIQVEQSLAPVPQVMTDNHKVLMILFNLLSNARDALEACPVEQRRLCVTLEGPSDGLLRLEVRDQGEGIAPELLPRIFQYGFTTRPKGHGFGLHSSALAAQELGGSLRVHSEGPGRGATFTLELPYLPAETQ